MKIGSFEFKKNIFLAPMAGVTEVGFRKVCQDYGAEMCVSEMVSAQALAYENEKTKNLLLFPKDCKCKVVQIFGHDPLVMSNIAKELSKSYDIIDINMGCPAPKIFNNGDGSALMQNIDLAREIISECVKKSSVPITVKFRSGVDKEHINAVEFAKMCEEAGASAITIHARTRKQFYSGQVDYDIIKQVVNAVSIPVIGNGDIVDKHSYEKMLETGCSAVMIGRGALGNPEIFCNLLNENPPYSKKQAILNHISELQKYYNDNFISKHMRKHLLWYTSGMYNAKIYKEMIVKCNSTEELLNLVEKIF